MIKVMKSQKNLQKYLNQNPVIGKEIRKLLANDHICMTPNTT